MHYQTHQPATNITLIGTFRDWSDTSYHNVKLNGSSGDILILSWGAVYPDAEFMGFSDRLDILWEPGYLTDDSLGGGRPAYDYADLPFNASCTISLDNHIGSIIVGNLSGPSLQAKTNRGMLRIDNCSFTEIDGAATTRINASFASENATFRSDTGDITMQATGKHGTITARANDGNIVLKLPRDSGFTINASTRAGRVNCDIPVNLSIEEPGHIRGVTNTPYAKPFSIELETQRGDILILYY